MGWKCPPKICSKVVHYAIKEFCLSIFLFFSWFLPFFVMLLDFPVIGQEILNFKHPIYQENWLASAKRIFEPINIDVRRWKFNLFSSPGRVFRSLRERKSVWFIIIRLIFETRKEENKREREREEKSKKRELANKIKTQGMEKKNLTVLKKKVEARNEERKNKIQRHLSTFLIFFSVG